MKVTYKSKNGRFLIEATGDTVKDCFAQVGGAAAVFEAESTCGKCNSSDIRPNFKIVKDGKFKYYELVCMSCRAQFSFGQATSGDILFPKRKDDNGPLPFRGWRIFGEHDSEGESPEDYERSPPVAAAVNVPASFPVSGGPAWLDEKSPSLQAILDRLADRMKVTAPTTLRSAMKALFAEYQNRLGKEEGAMEFMATYSAWLEARKGHAVATENMRDLCATMWNRLVEVGV